MLVLIHKTITSFFISSIRMEFICLLFSNFFLETLSLGFSISSLGLVCRDASDGSDLIKSW